MAAYETVVAGVSDTETGFRAVELAAQLAGETGVKLILVAAYRQGAGAQPEHDTYQSAGSARAEKALERAVRRCAEVGAEDVETYALPGDPVSVLTAAIQERNADLLVVGSHGLSTLGGRLLGSVPAGISREASCDVLIVHTTTDRWRKLVSRRHRTKRSTRKRTVVVGVHDSPRSLRAADKAAAVAADGDAELVIVGAYDEAEKKELAYATDTLQKESHLVTGSFPIQGALYDGEVKARGHGVDDVRRVIVRGDPIKGLLKVIRKNKADLVVLGNHQLTGRTANLIGSISSQVSRKTATHILLVH